MARPAGGARRPALLVALAGLAMGALVAGPAAGAAAMASSGDAVITQVGETDVPVLEGGSASEFTLRLPQDAACPGDSAHDDYRFQTFVIPEDHDPGALRYEATKPVGARRWALYDVSTRQVTDALTEMNDGEGEPGRIGGLPAFSFGVFPPEELPPGRYRIGVACTYSRITERYWDARIELRADAADEPGGFRWRALGRPVQASGGDASALPAALLVGLGAASGAALLIRRSRRRSAGPLPKEHP